MYITKLKDQKTYTVSFIMEGPIPLPNITLHMGIIKG